MKKILIYGVGSLKNRGCEALVNSTIAQIDKKVEIVVASFDFENNKCLFSRRVNRVVNHHIHDVLLFDDDMKNKYDYYNSIEYDYNNFECLYQKEVIKEMETADLCIHVGGDNYCYGANEWMYALNTKAKELGKKTILWGASLFDEITDLSLIENLKKYDLLMLREKISYNAVKKFIDEERLLLIPDPAFSLNVEKTKLNSWYSRRNVLGLNLSPLTIKNDDNYLIIKQFIQYVLDNTNYSIALIPHVTFDEVSDMKVLRRIKDDYISDDRIFLEESDLGCEQLKYLISKCQMFIAARTHASIAAYSTCVPTLVLGYSVKSRGIAEDLFGNYKDYVLPIEDLDYDNLISKFKFIDDNKDEIRNNLSSKIEKIRHDASNLYKIMLDRLDFLERKYVCDKRKCTACSACLSICPNNAIKLKKDNEGFLYPIIDQSKCTNCGLCRKTCPCLKNNFNKSGEYLVCYAAKSKDCVLKRVSSSGGIFSHLASVILKKNGVVYGAILFDFSVRHVRITDESDMYKVRGSKYAQSDLSGIFKKVKKDLLSNKLVLFSGTPCQISGLRGFLGQDYDNLYTVSVMCHGVMNSDVLQKRICEFEKFYDTKVTNINFKSKKNGWEKSSISYYSDRIDKTYEFNDDSLMFLYLNNFILRESCYNCEFKGLNNDADVILGDYWGISNVHPDMFDSNGVSCVILKTRKGKQLFDDIVTDLICIETDFDEIIKYNGAFVQSVLKPLYRNLIFRDLEYNSLKTIYDKCKNDIKIKDLNEKNSTLQDRINNSIDKSEFQKILEENNKIYVELNNIYNSKRYKIVDKVLNKINRLRGKI